MDDGCAPAGESVTRVLERRAGAVSRRADGNHEWSGNDDAATWFIDLDLRTGCS
jgi:hypothetical protein